MTPSSLVSHDDYGVQQSMALGPWGDTSQYTPTPRNLRWPPASPSDISYTNVDPISPLDYASPQKLLRKRIVFRYSSSVIRRKVEHMTRIRRLVSAT
jgi:hypothetical protein